MNNEITFSKNWGGNYQLRIPYPAKISFKMKIKINIFPDRHRKKFLTSTPELLKDVLGWEGRLRCVQKNEEHKNGEYLDQYKRPGFFFDVSKGN